MEKFWQLPYENVVMIPNKAYYYVISLSTENILVVTEE